MSLNSPTKEKQIGSTSRTRVSKYRLISIKGDEEISLNKGISTKRRERNDGDVVKKSSQR